MNQELKDLLRSHGINPNQVLAFRHVVTAREPKLSLCDLARSRLDMFDTYQKNQRAENEQKMLRASHVASFIGLEPKRAHFVRLYTCGDPNWLTCDEFWSIAIHKEMKNSFDFIGFQCDSPHTLYMDLDPVASLEHLRGRLVVGWQVERDWVQWVAKNHFPVDIRSHNVFGNAT